MSARQYRLHDVWLRLVQQLLLTGNCEALKLCLEEWDRNRSRWSSILWFPFLVGRFEFESLIERNNACVKEAIIDYRNLWWLHSRLICKILDTALLALEEVDLRFGGLQRALLQILGNIFEPRDQVLPGQDTHVNDLREHFNILRGA